MKFKTIYAVPLALILVITSWGLPPQGRGARGQRAGQRGREQTARLPGGTTAYRDLAYVTNGHPQQKLDLFVPKANAKVPLIIFIHGGAFSRGDKDGQDPVPFLSDGY